jgi:phasin family protein
MLSLPDQILRAAEAHMTEQVDNSAALAAGAMHGMQQIAGLNINMVRATLEQANFATRQLLSAQDLRQLLALAAEQLQPNARQAFDYGYYLSTIAADMQLALIRFAGIRIAEAEQRLATLVADHSTPCAIASAGPRTGALPGFLTARSY